MNSLVQLIPKYWFKEKDKSSIWITAYRITLVEKAHFKNSYVYDFEKLRAIISWGSMRFLDTSNLKSNVDHKGFLKTEGKAELNVTPEMGWLVIIQPFTVDGYEQPDHEIRKKSGIYAALYVAINGRNMAFEKVFENVAQANDSKCSSFSSTFINPRVFPIPDLSEQRLNLIH